MLVENINKTALKEVHTHIQSYIHNTPVFHSSIINEITGADIKFKCENFQKMGAFKMRGAINAILCLPEAERKLGVVTHSSGNFAQAVALSAKLLNIPAYIVMPESAPKVKVDAVRSYGGIITMVPSTLKDREANAKRIQEETGAAFLHPSNQIEVILGNATAAMEYFKDHFDTDYLLAPIGGGGLVAGTALACKFFSDNCITIGAEPKNVDDAYRSLMTGKIENNSSTDTIADGLRTTLGDINFPIIQSNVNRIITVEEDEIIQAVKLIWERMKLVVEPSSAVPFAAVLKEKDFFKGKKVGIILSGGNVDLNNLPF
ncbi:MAG: threonine/serine dehydratase [Bacteroidota bacterium]